MGTPETYSKISLPAPRGGCGILRVEAKPDPHLPEGKTIFYGHTKPFLYAFIPYYPIRPRGQNFRERSSAGYLQH
jgi:hypothetical protein